MSVAISLLKVGVPILDQYGSDKPKFLRRDATEANADAAGSVASLQG
ncbi:hypothetical protein [Mastigocoleus sp. MO_188.B34]|nr:hypothetical protein [Mastigocoleus sp. MO_188.B34]MDJ0693244.1 hypothetical protein [Mastigocoleus sp. MO_188.B34]